MEKLISTALLMCTLFLGNVAGQQILAEAYNKEKIHEDFNKAGDIFKIVTTTDNYFILDNGDYLLSRNNNESEYAIIASNSFSSNFILKTLLRIGPSINKEASIGIILKVQEDGKGALIFEINTNGEYRIKQLKGSSYHTLSGNNPNNSWIKNKIINGVDERNFVEIRSENNIYDVYVNNNYLTTFFIPDYASGYAGLIITAATKARISYFYLNEKNKDTQIESHLNDDDDEITTIEELNKKIKILKEDNAQLNELKSEAKDMQDQERKILNVAAAELQEKIDSKEKEILALNSSITNLKNSTVHFEGLEEKYNKILTKVSKLTTEIEKITVKNNVLQSSEIDLSSKNSALTLANTQQKKEIKAFNISNSNLKNSNTELNIKIKELNKQIAIIQQHLSTEQTINTELTKDLNRSISENASVSTKLNKKISTFQSEINSLEKSKNEITYKLSSEKNAHTNTKNGLSKVVTNKNTEIKTLEAQLSKINKELLLLRKTQAEHSTITNTLKGNNATLSMTIDNLNEELTSLKNEIKKLTITNTELKELFILKDFELNGVKPSDLTKQTNTYPAPKELLKRNSAIYTVQFGVYMQIQPHYKLKELDEVWHETTEHGTYVYLSGKFKSPEEATEHKNSLIPLGYPNAFVVIFTK